MNSDVFRTVSLQQILDIELDISLTPEQWSRILEQILLMVLILGRFSSDKVSRISILLSNV